MESYIYRTTSGMFCLFLFLVSIPFIVAKQEQGLSGTRQPCNNEGEMVAVDDIPDMKKCFNCVCRNGYVLCNQKNCPVTTGCHLLIPKKPDECCHRCRGCTYRGQFYDSHTEWTDPTEPCRLLRCEAGVITEADMQCYTPCRNPLPPAPGKCCATCPGCRINGQNVTEERDVTIPEDPCVKCHCEGGRMTCMKKACPVLQCVGRYQYRVSGECCKQCSGSRRLIPIPQKCLVGDSVINSNNHLEKDSCTQCTCTNETAVCRRKTCPVLECDPDLQKTKPGECCPQCPPVEEVKTTCTIGGKTYQDGESWQLDSCKSCMCHRGEPRCAMQRCHQRSESCPHGYKSVKRPGQCCTECVENDGVCTVFGDPHYKTYDGKFFSFQGSCKYQLTADCTTHAFSVRVTNDARNTRQSAWTRTVSLKAGDVRVNLGQKLRVKVNGQRVEPPFVKEGRVRIERRNESILVTTHAGVSLLWNGGGFLEVSASVGYKGKLCGLCGNFNSVAQDDLVTRRGKVLTDADVWKFGNSWRVGGKRACGRQGEFPVKKQPCKSGKYACRHLKDGGVFGGCDARLNAQNYYEACLQDMCECPAGSCHCEALSAYARECQRLGVTLPDWRKDARCRGGGRGGAGGRKGGRGGNRVRSDPVRPQLPLVAPKPARGPIDPPPRPPRPPIK